MLVIGSLWTHKKDLRPGTISPIFYTKIGLVEPVRGMWVGVGEHFLLLNTSPIYSHARDYLLVYRLLTRHAGWMNLHLFENGQLTLASDP